MLLGTHLYVVLEIFRKYVKYLIVGFISVYGMFVKLLIKSTSEGSGYSGLVMVVNGLTKTRGTCIILIFFYIYIYFVFSRTSP